MTENDKRIIEERYRKIIELYHNRNYTQEEVAQEMGLTVEQVRGATKYYGFHNTTIKEHCPLIVFDELIFLLK